MRWEVHFGDLSEKYFTSARGAIVVDGDQPLEGQGPGALHQDDLDEEMLQVGELNEQEEAAKQALLSKLERQEEAANKKVEETKRRRAALQTNLSTSKARKTLAEGDAAAERANAVNIEGAGAADCGQQSD